MRTTLKSNQKDRLRNAGLVTVTTTSQTKRGIVSFLDPITNAEYLLSPRGYAYRKSYAGMYQLNPRGIMKASPKNKRSTRATLRTTDLGAQTELVLKGVRSFRNR